MRGRSRGKEPDGRDATGEVCGRERRREGGGGPARDRQRIQARERREGEKIVIDLDRTQEIFEAVPGRFGRSIAQRGITGTPLCPIGRSADRGIRGGNVGTQRQYVADSLTVRQ